MIRLRGIRLDGFRGYPRAVAFDLSNQQSLLLFGRNGHGKSSLTDAFEFLVSPNGTLKRLGLKKGDTTSGRAPLRNARLPSERTATIRVSFDHGAEHVEVARAALETDAEVPTELRPLIDATVVPFVIRGTELRHFVYQTPRERYEELARSLNASRLTQLQKDIRETAKQLRQDLRSDARLAKGIDEATKRLTNAAVKRFDATQLVLWLNIPLAEVGISLETLSASDAGYSKLRLCEANERSTKLLDEARKVLSGFTPRDGASVIHKWMEPIAAAQQRVNEIAQATVDAPMSDLVKAAAEFLQDPMHASDACPLCNTAYPRTSVGSRTALCKHVDEIAERLEDLRLSNERLFQAQQSLERQRDEAAGVLRQVLTAASLPEVRIEELIDLLRHATMGRTDDLRSFDAAVRQMIDDLERAGMTQEERADGKTFGQLLEVVDAVMEITRKREEIDRRSKRREQIISQVEAAASFIDERIYGFFESTISAISSDTVAFYNDVQQYSRVPVRVRVALMNPENEDARGVELLIDFDNLPAVKPQAYLSDSQQHTLALALRLAIIKHFNRQLPLVVLDDVVTSFDAENRNTIAAALLVHLKDMQLIVLTHDDLFWRIMRSAMRPTQNKWIVKRIIKYEPEGGPIFSDDKGDVAEIRALINAGDSHAAAAVRKFYERWLHQMCRCVGARPLMPPENDPYNYTNRDLLDSFVGSVKKYGLSVVLEQDKEMQRVLAQMGDSVVLNKGTHGDDSIDGEPSLTDVEKVFDDILRFMSLFVCSCGSRAFRHDQAASKVRCSKCDAVLAISLGKGPAST